MNCRSCRQRPAARGLRNGLCGECLIDGADENAIAAICLAASVGRPMAKQMIQRFGWRHAVALAEAVPRNERGEPIR